MNVDPDWEDDGRAGWMWAIDVIADPTGRDRTVTFAPNQPTSWTVSPAMARLFAEAIVAAADYAERKG